MRQCVLNLPGTIFSTYAVYSGLIVRYRVVHERILVY
eukprot:SAG31_NODE_12537_length_934_cov_0.974850_1_plen_36_part_10